MTFLTTNKLPSNQVLAKHIITYAKYFQMKEISFPLDLPFLITNLHTLCPSNEKENITESILTKRIVEFASFIQYHYFYSLGIVDILYTIILISYLSEIKNFKLNQLNYILTLLETKHKLNPVIGYPIGTLTALVIGESMTQSSLSNFHGVKKGGDEIDLTSMDNNMNYMNLNFEPKENIIILSATDPNSIHDLYMIKQRIEYCNLKLLNYQLLSLNKIDKSHIQLIIRIDIAQMKSYHLSMTFVEIMIMYNLEELNFIQQCNLISKKYDSYCEFNIQLTMDQKFLPFLLIFIPFFSKGVHSLNKFSIVDIPNGKRLIMVGETEYLSSVDTSKMHIKIQTEYAYKYGGLQVFNHLLNSYTESKLALNNFHLLAAFQCRYSKPLKVKKYKNSIQPLTSAITHNNTYYDMQDHALRRQKQLYSINSSILLQSPIKLGTGYYQTYIDITPYLRSKIKENMTGPESIILA
jgi:hypothetical protein